MTERPLHNIASGEDSRPPIVLLHGFAADGEIWADIQNALRGRRKSLAFDLPGHGREGDRPIGNARVLADAVSASLDALGLARVHLVGHSLGGAVAMVIALRDPGRCASLTLLAPGGFGPEINHRLLRRFGKAREEPELSAIVEEMFGFEANIPGFIVQRLVEERRDPTAHARLAALAELILDGPRQRTLPLARLGDLPCPVKVLWGTQDRMVPARQSQGLPGIVGTHVFEGVGHMVHLEVPQETARLILENAAVD